MLLVFRKYPVKVASIEVRYIYSAQLPRFSVTDLGEMPGSDGQLLDSSLPEVPQGAPPELRTPEAQICKSTST